MKTRIFRQILKKIKCLPAGIHLFKYILNHIQLYISRKRKAFIQPYPNSIMLEVTNHCQLRCITCAREYSFGKEMEKGHLDITMAKKIIDEMYIYLDKIALTGLGEPFLYPHLKELIAYIKNKNPGILIFISTNAQLKNFIEILTDIGRSIDTLQISIDGIGDSFINIRRNSDFSLFNKNVTEIIRLSREKKFDVKFNMVVFEQNYTDMVKVIEFAKQNNIREVCFNTLNQVSIIHGISSSTFYKSREFIEELDKVKKLADTYNIFFEAPNLEHNNSFKTCPYPWGNYTVSWNGYLVPCCAKPFPKVLHFGSVFSDGLLPCINHDRLIAFRKMAIKNKTPDFCIKCHHVEN